MLEQTASDIAENFEHVDATFWPTTGAPVTLNVEKRGETDLQPGGFEGQSWEQMTTILYVFADIGREVDTVEVFEISSIKYTVRSVIENDGHFVKCEVS
jgi:hypothetical protein